MKFYNYIFRCLIYLIPILAIGQTQDIKNPKIELNGYIKNIQSTYFIQKIDSNSSSNLIHNRLNLKFNVSSKFSARLEVRNRIFYGEQIKQTPNFGAIIDQYSGILKLSHLWVNEKSFVVHSVIDRMLIQYSDNNWDITVGRQRINWGINNVWNPNDIFNAYDFLDFDYEERPGNDAVRIQHYLKNNSTVEIAYKPDKNNKHTAALLYKFNKWKYDFQFLSGIFERDYVLGGGWAGSIKDAGFKGEFSCFIPQKRALEPTASFSLSLMADRTLKNDWYIALATLYNSNPTNIFMPSGSFYGSTLTAKSLFPFRYNVYSTIVKTISPISSITVSTIYSPQQNTLILFPSFAWNVATNFDLDFTSQSFFTKRQNSHYFGSAVFIRGRWSF